LWPAEPNVLGKQATYCVESMNGVSWLKDKVEDDGKEAKLAIVSRPGEYGLDGAVGAALAAEALGIEVVYDGTDQLAGDDRTAVVSQLVSSGATMVWLTSTGGETLDIFGQAVSQGFEADWSGNQPSFDYKLSGASDFAAEFDQYYWPSNYNDPWGGSDSEGMQDMIREMTERRPDLPDSEAYLIGWMEGLIVQQVLEQAAANGDMTRAGLVEAAGQIEVDYKGLAPNQRWAGDYDEIVVRQTYIYDFDATAFNIGTLGSPGMSGLTPVVGPFVADIAADYAFGGPCV
jgi:ABC-type branched-subunit amino acid transport system substrate-binding protein